MVEEKDLNKINYTSWLLIGLPLLFILFGYTTSLLDPALHSKFLLLSLFLGGFSVLLVLNRNKIKTGILRERIFLWYGIYFLLMAVSLISSSNLADGIFDVMKITLFLSLLVCFAVYFRGSGEVINILVKLISLFAFVAGLIGIYQLIGVLETSKLNHLSTYVISATFAHRNLYAEALFLTLPFTLYGIIKGEKFWKYLGIIASAITFFLIVTLLVRAVWLALVAGCFFTIIIYLFTSRKINVFSNGGKSLRKYWLIIAFAIMAIGSAVFIYFRQGSLEVFKKQSVSIMDATYGSAKDRKDLWIRTLKLIKQKPVAGWGAGSWKVQSLRYSVKGTQMEDAITFYQNPHNDYLWIWSEAGIVTLVFYLLIFFTAFYYLYFILKKTEGTESFFYYLLFAGLAGYLTFASLSFPRDRMEESLLLMFILLPIVIKYHSLQDRKALSATMLIGLLPIGFMLLVIGWQRMISEHKTLEAFKAKSEQRWYDVISDINAAESPLYKMDPISTPLRWHSGMAYYNLGDKVRAYGEFMEAYKVNPYHVHVLNNIATCLEESGKHEEAIIFYKKALAINPVFEDALLNLAAVYFNQKQIDSAASLVARVPYESTNPKIRQYILAIVPAKVEQMLGHWPKPDEEYFKKVAASPERCYKTFITSRNYPQSLRRELEMEARDSTRNIKK